MAVGRRASATGSAYYSGAGTGTVTPGAVPQDTDLIVALATSSAVTNWTTLPTGFEKQGPTIGAFGSSSIQVFAKRARVGEPSSYTFGCSPTIYGAVLLLTYTGAADVGPIARMAGDSLVSSDTIDWPTLSIPVTGGAVVYTSIFSGNPTVAPPTGFTAGPTANRAQSFDTLNPSVGSLTGLTSLSSVVETHTVAGLFVTATLQIPVNSSAPVLSGNNWNGQPLAVNFGEWLGPDAYDIVWKRDGVAI